MSSPISPLHLKYSFREFVKLKISAHVERGNNFINTLLCRRRNCQVFIEKPLIFWEIFPKNGVGGTHTKQQQQQLSSANLTLDFVKNSPGGRGGRLNRPISV